MVSLATKPLNGFLGTHEVTLDEKGRINIPAKFKAYLEKEDSSALVLCVMENCLTVFPQSQWVINEEKMNELSDFDQKDRNFLRKYYSRAAECEIKSGKLLIPAKQREMAGLEKEIVVVGMSKTFEIWSQAKWDQFENEQFGMN